MDLLAMSSTTHNLWHTANILGLVVVVAVAALLSLLQQNRNDEMTKWVDKVKKDFTHKIHYQAGYAPPATTTSTSPTTT